MSDEIIRLPDAPAPLTRPGIRHHFCEHPGCGRNGACGFARPKQPPHWFCFEHRSEGERYL
jgi:hypothetical protein